jgi:hypothetical protein
VKPINPKSTERFFQLCKIVKDRISRVNIVFERDIEQSNSQILKKCLLARIRGGKRRPKDASASLHRGSGNGSSISVSPRPDDQNLLSIQCRHDLLLLAPISQTANPTNTLAKVESQPPQPMNSVLWSEIGRSSETDSVQQPASCDVLSYARASLWILVTAFEGTDSIREGTPTACGPRIIEPVIKRVMTSLSVTPF